ncbi:MAG: hypothetical protein ACI4SF_01665 [Oscillospiraceae bacterium]
MTRKEAEKLYKASRQTAAPDMDKLWERIEDRLTEKNTAEKQPTVKRHNITLKRCLGAAAVCAAAAIILPFAFSPYFGNMKSSSDSAAYIQNDEAFAEASDECLDAEANSECEENNDTADMAALPEYINSAERTQLDYNALDLAEGIDAGLRGKGSGDGLFDEDSILAETVCFVDGIVENVYAGEECIYYELRAVETYGNAGADEELLTIASDSDIPMLLNREYLVPLKQTEDGFQTAVESVPQIELTLDRGMVFYNGWKSLDDESALEISCPKQYPDDHFYDRMKFSYSGYMELIRKWQMLSEK